MWGSRIESAWATMIFALLYTSWLRLFTTLRVPSGNRPGLLGLESPEGLAPPVQECSVLGPRSGRLAQKLKLLEIVLGHDGAPALVLVLVILRRANVLGKARFTDPERSVVGLSLDETHLVRASGHVGPPQLHVVVLPEADRTDLVRSGRLPEYAVATARARKRLSMHERSVARKARESHRPDSGAGQPAGVAGSRVAGGHHGVTRSALDAVRRRANSEASGRRLGGHLALSAWNARPMPVPRRVSAQDLVGHVVTGSASSWYVDDESGDRALVHVWLFLDGSPAMFSTLNGVVIYREPVSEPYLMTELGGRVVIERSAGHPWDGLIGKSITRVRRLVDFRVDAEAGWVVEAGERQMAVVDLGDELVAGTWPDEDQWTARCVMLEDRAEPAPG